MRISATAMLICLALFLCFLGCSREEPPPPQAKSAKVVKPVRKAIPEQRGGALPGKEAKSGDRAPETIEAEIASLEEALKALGPTPGEENRTVQDIVRHHEPKPTSAPTKIPPTGKGPETPEEIKEAMGEKVSVLEEKGLKTPAVDISKQVEETEKMAGFFFVWKAEALPAIAAKEDVFGDPQKWPILYRLNKEMLGALNLGDDVLNKKVPEGFRLKVLSPDEKKANLESQLKKKWVVNVLSTTDEKRMVPVAIRLIENGYKVYIARVEIKGKEWMRLRVGFFNSLDEGNTEEEKIRRVANLGDLWVTQIAKEEIEEFGSY
ncbi:MAG: SPOR domain-containing protein [Thermodesulfobacteriota bacterium]|nr:SPOR domain-containing protein [Thermodesulfobacteriota bacterium]